jgi:diketogulonate reductase-like aldo/keto reductase
MAAATSPALKLNNGVEMPALGLPSSRARPKRPSPRSRPLCDGYRLIDTAAACITFYRDSGHASALEHPVIGRIADAHSKSPARVMLRWGLRHGALSFRSPPSPRGSPRTSMSSTSSSLPTR